MKAFDKSFTDVMEGSSIGPEETIMDWAENGDDGDIDEILEASAEVINKDITELLSQVLRSPYFQEFLKRNIEEFVKTAASLNQANIE